MNYQHNALAWVNDMTDAIAKRILAGDPTYDLYEYDEVADAMVVWKSVDLPTPQRTGTYYQQLTYARLKARPLAESLLP
tara:strand:+ start:298 stop:534 length:237 start_codon:yes stop_codon:yes gene_type:complete